MTVVSRAIDPWGAQPQPQPITAAKKLKDNLRDFQSAFIFII
jgi:hypothetical protein